MQDGSYNDSDEERESQSNLDDEQSEEEDIIQSVSPNSAIREAIKNMKKQLSANHISCKNGNINEKVNSFPIIPLDKLSTFLMKFVKKANLSLYNRRILFAAITPIHHIYLHVINGKQYKGSSSQSIRSTSLSPPYDPNSLKKCFDYFIKVFKLIQYDIQPINATFFIQQFQSIIEKLQSIGQDDFIQIESDIGANIQSISHNFQKLHESESINTISYKQITRCKVDLKRFKIMILPFFNEDDQDPLKTDFLSYYNNFYGELKNFELFYKVNWIIKQFQQNWDEPLFWFLPCQMANVNSNIVFNSAMEYLQTFWTTCDLTFISDTPITKPESPENDKNDTENSSTELETDTDPENVRINMFHVLDLMSFQNKLAPQKTSVITRSFIETVNKYNSYFNLYSTLSPTNFDIEDIKTIISIVSALPYTMKNIACDLNHFLTERFKLLKQYMYIYNSENNNNTMFNTRKNNRCNFASLISHSHISSTSSTSRFAQQILCNANYNEIFTYVYSFVIFASNAKENQLLFPMIKNELHRLISFYSELLLKSQMTNDSRTLANEALLKAKEFELDNLNSLQSIKEVAEIKDQEDEETTVDLFYALKELTISTKRVLATNFIKDEKRDFMERFYTFLEICCPYFQNLKQQQIQNEHKIDMNGMKEFLSSAFPLFDIQDIFRFESQDLDAPQIFASLIDKEIDESKLESEDVCNEIDLKSIWTDENKELLFNKSFPSIREQARNLQIGISDDWRSVFEFKMIYKTFCRLFIVSKHHFPINENPTEFESDIHKFFSVATKFVMDENYNIRETIIPLSTIINSCRSLSIKWMFSSTSKKDKNNEEEDKENNNDSENDNDSEVSQDDKQHWDYLSLLFGIAFISVPHPIQTISIFLSMLTSREKVMEVEGRQLSSFKNLFYSFLENFNEETTDNFVKSPCVQSVCSVFENELDFFFISDNKIQRQNIRQILVEINKMKEKYTKLSDIMSMMNTKYFDKPDSYSRLFVEIAFFANILKSFKDTLEILKRFDLLSAPSSDSDLGSNYISILNSTWPFSPGFLDLDMYKSGLPDFLLSLHSSISRLSLLRPNFMTIRRTFDFYMNLALSSFSFCFSSLNQMPQNYQDGPNLRGNFETNQFCWNRENYKDEHDSKKRNPFEKNGSKSDEDDFIDIFSKEEEESEKLNKSSITNSNDSNNQLNSIDEIRVHFHALAVLYSQSNENPSVLLCCEILARTTALIKLLDESSLSDFSFLAKILSGLSEASFAIINALNIKKEVDKIVNSLIYFAELFGIKLTKTQKSSTSNSSLSTLLSPTRKEVVTTTTTTESPTPLSQTTPPASPTPNSSQQQQQQQQMSSVSSSSFQESPQPKKKKVHSISDDKNGAVSHSHHSKTKKSHSSHKRSFHSASSASFSAENEINDTCLSAESSLNIPSLADFPSLSASFKSAIPVLDRMAETIPQDKQEVQHFYRARSLFNSIKDSLDQIKIPTTSDQFLDLISQSNQKMEMLQHHSRCHLKRIRQKIENCDVKFKKMQSLIESDYSCITQKIEEETINGEQLDEDITNAKAELKRRSRNSGRTTTTTKSSSSTIKEKKQRSEISNLNSTSKDVLNFNFNIDSSSSSSSSKKNKPIARAQLIMAQAQELQRQNNIIQIQLQKNELEHSILNSIEKNKLNDSNDFVESQSTINNVVQSILSNVDDVFVPESLQRKPLFDQDEDEKPSNVLSKSSILSLMTEIIKWEEKHQNITTIDHKDLCDKVELLAYSLISGTKTKENEMVKLQNQLKNVRGAQKDKLLKLRNVLHEIDLDEE